MRKIEKILCPVDFSEFAARAYRYARSLAQHYNAALILQHVTEPLLSIHRSYMSAPFIEDAFLNRIAMPNRSFKNSSPKIKARVANPNSFFNAGQWRSQCSRSRRKQISI